MTVYVTRKNTLFTFRDMDEDSNDQELSDNQTEQDDRNGKIKLKKTVIVGKSKDGKRGVVYLSSIAPGLNPSRIRTLLSRYGEIVRTYLEPDKIRKDIIISYKEGWVEFKRKKDAKAVAEHLNGTQVGGKKKSSYHDSIWTIKYLNRFKWHHLTEQMSMEKRLKDQRLRFEVGRAKKEVEFYEEQVDELRRRKRNAKSDDIDVVGRVQFYNKKQRATDEQIRASKPQETEDDFLNRIFS